jgi:DNA repair exonuclease SbcCD ATPase subunit
MPSADAKESAGSILKELVFNQYQAILAGGAALASVVTLNPLPLLLFLGGELVLLPILDSGPLRRLVKRRRNAASRKEEAAKRAQLLQTFSPASAKAYHAMETLCRQIETNYQGLHGISQVYLAEQRHKLDVILEGCVHRLTALQRYERLLASRNPRDLEKEIQTLEQELKQPDLPERARAAVQKNIELKRRLLQSYSDARGTMKALSSELDSMASLLEVLHQSSISMRDPQTISHELDNIVRQSEDSGRAVREMEALLRSDGADWIGGSAPADNVVQYPGQQSRKRVKDR